VLVGYSFTAAGEYFGGSMKRWLPIRYRRANPDQSIILPEDWPASI
jgi:hypothetical protein